MRSCVPRSNVSGPLSPDDFSFVREPVDAPFDNIFLATDANSKHGNFKMTPAVSVILV